LSTKSEQLEWKIQGRSNEGKGLSYAEIAQELQVSKASIGSDVQYIHEQAKGTIKEYMTEHLPEQYQVCLNALDTIVKHALTYWKHLKTIEKSCRQWNYSRIPI
jgi:endonuclease III-like uncharacterized protein